MMVYWNGLSASSLLPHLICSWLVMSMMMIMFLGLLEHVHICICASWSQESGMARLGHSGYSFMTL